MTQPVPYERLFNFADYAIDNPINPYNPSQHDDEFDAVKENLDGLNTNIALLQRDDGLLVNGSVHPNALSSATRLLIANWNIRGAWATFTTYSARDFIEFADAGYVAMVGHTSGSSFAFDLASGYWLLVESYDGAVSLKTFGAAGDGITDDTAAFQAAIIAVNPANTRCRKLRLPTGRYRITDSLALPNSAAFFIWEGDGRASTTLIWDGPPGIPFIKTTNARECVFKDFGITGNALNPPSYAIQCNIAAGQLYSGAPGSNYFERLDIGQGIAANEVSTGIGFTCDSGQDRNNDRNVMIGVNFNDCAKGLAIEHLNSLWNSLYSCSFAACGKAVSNIGGANSNVANVGGSFTAFGCSSGMSGVVFELIGSTHAISVHGWQSEADVKLLDMPFSVADNANVGGGAAYITANFTFHGLNLYGINTAANPFIKFDAGKGSTLDFIGCKAASWVSVAGLDLSFPTAGSAVRIVGGQWKIKTLSYNNTVFMDQITDITGASAPYTNLGSGRLITGFNDFPNNTLLTTTHPLAPRTLEFWTDNLPQSSGTVTLSDGFSGRGYMMPKPGFIRSLTAKSNAPITAGNATFQVRVNGVVSSNFNTQLNTTNPTLLPTNQNSMLAANAFAAGDMITVSVVGDGSLLPNGTADFDAAVEVVY